MKPKTTKKPTPRRPEAGIKQTKNSPLTEGGTADARALTQMRGSVHGNWMDQARTAQEFKSAARGAILRRPPSIYQPSIQGHHIEAVEMILVKLSRILNGDPNHEDHWDDIAGYAHLGKNGHV